jgi:hypothetical protein
MARRQAVEDRENMTESTRTVTYVVVAAVSVAIAWFAIPPLEITPSQLANVKRGEPFFDDFNANDATSIRVVAFDEARAMARPFSVEFKDGLWTIPSHHGYPADGKDQLAKTAASTIGIKRDEFRSASKEDHEELGVVDPLDQDSSKLKGRGKRITLSKGDNVLFDLIVGKQVRERPGFNFVRVPSEDSTYVTKLDINLSTKFGDWVETDLLKLNRDHLTEMVIDNYSIAIEGGRGKIVPGEDLHLERAKPSDPWKLVGLDDESQELDTSKIAEMVSTLDDLKLVGVRPKPKGLRPDMTVDTEYVQNQIEAQMLVADLSSRGYELAPADRSNPQQLRMYSRQGDLNVATTEGVVYTLRFGEIFSGDESETEIGGDSDGKKDSTGKDKEGESDETDPAAGKQSSRYLFVTTRFDDKYIGAAPVEPERPPGLPEEEKKAESPKIQPGAKSSGSSGAKKSQPAKKEAKKVEECGPEPADDDEEKTDDKAAEDKPAEDKPETPAEAKPKTELELQREYFTLRQKYDADLKSYEEKIKTGKEKVDELNRRFGEWYYVISAENFNKLHLGKKDLVKAKAQAAGDKPAADETDSADPKPNDKP